MDLQTSIRALIASYFTGGPKAKPMAEAVAELVAPVEIAAERGAKLVEVVRQAHERATGDRDESCATEDLARHLGEFASGWVHRGMRAEARLVTASEKLIAAEAEVDRWSRADAGLRKLGVEVYHDNTRQPGDGDLVIVREDMRQAEEKLAQVEHLLKIGETANAEVVVEYRKECAARDKLAKFKAYVHARLDAAGVPVDPPSDHQVEGCRIGGRLDIVLAVVLAARGMVGKADARLELSGAASWNPQGIDFQPLLEALAPIACPLCHGLRGGEEDCMAGGEHYTQWQDCPTCGGTGLPPTAGTTTLTAVDKAVARGDLKEAGHLARVEVKP